MDDTALEVTGAEGNQYNGYRHRCADDQQRELLGKFKSLQHFQRNTSGRHPPALRRGLGL
ncbi:hypothetical protein [Leisingera sp. JC1]|uniref:hypothetical protein n=1 Tax=Leisingera sp. JC1 TaxID=1855282 RepID=UPI0020C7C637|nr:hypothetical protein [Leisingera sp. JC1]